MTNELTDVRCSCGDEYPADSYDAGFIAGSGMCQNCDAALPPKDICTCPSGDGSLRHPCPAHPAVEQAGGDERAAVRRLSEEAESTVIGMVEYCLNARVCLGMDEGFKSFDPEEEHDFVKELREFVAARAALAQPSTKCANCGDTGQIVVSGPHYCGQFQPPEYETEPCDMCSQPSPAQADEKPGDSILCYGCFAKGVGPEHFDEAGKCLVRQQLDPLNLAQHAEEFNEAPAEALKPEQAKAERLDWSSALLDVAVLQEALTSRDSDERMKNMDAGDVIRRAFGKLKEIRAQHDRIIGELRAEIAMLRSYESEWELLLNQHEQERDAALAEVERLRQFERICEGLPQDAIDGGWTVQGIRRYAKRLEDQLKVALARVAELETALAPFAAVADAYDDSEDGDHEPYTDMGCDDRLRLTLGQHRAARTALSGAPFKAQHSAGYAEARQCANCRHIGINDAGADGNCPECGGFYELEAQANVPSQAQHCVPEVSGIGRDFAYPRSVVLYLRTEPTDDDLRAIHDGLRSLAAAPGKEVGHE
ncbi:TPA: hypothetical protein ACXN0B_000842 [Pseudomonas aeruginosa]